MFYAIIKASQLKVLGIFGSMNTCLHYINNIPKPKDIQAIGCVSEQVARQLGLL